MKRYNYNVYIPAHSDDALHRICDSKNEAIQIAKKLAKKYENYGGVLVVWETRFSLFSLTIGIERLVYKTKIYK